MKKETLICLLGYAVAQMMICELTDAGWIERVMGVLGATPIGMYCAWMDIQEERQP